MSSISDQGVDSVSFEICPQNSAYEYPFQTCYHATQWYISSLTKYENDVINMAASSSFSEIAENHTKIGVKLQVCNNTCDLIFAKVNLLLIISSYSPDIYEFVEYIIADIEQHKILWN